MFGTLFRTACLMRVLAGGTWYLVLHGTVVPSDWYQVTGGGSRRHDMSLRYDLLQKRNARQSISRRKPEQVGALFQFVNGGWD